MKLNMPSDGDGGKDLLVGEADRAQGVDIRFPHEGRR